MRRAALLLALAVSCKAPPVAEPPSRSQLAAFVDAYLDGWARLHPSIAAGNGLHMHDDLLEDFSAAGIDQEVRWFRGQKTALSRIDTTGLTPDGFVDRAILLGVIDGWLLDLTTAKNWRRNPMVYASALSDGVHNLMTMESSPAEARMRQVLAKLAHVPELLQADADNMQNPPALLVRRGAGMFRGAAAMLRTDLRAAFANAGTPALRDSLASAGDAAAAQVEAHARWLERSLLPTATGKVALGADYVRARYRAEEMIDEPLDSLLALGQAQLAREQESFARAARQVDSTRAPLVVWQSVLADHPKRGELVAATRRAVDELRAFVMEKDLVQLPKGSDVVVAPSAPWDIGLASMHAAPPLETGPVKSFFYVTDADSTWPADRQDKWLQRFNTASLAITSAHEAMPGHFVHSLFMRRTPGKVRRIWIGLNPFPQPSSGQDGWAHYTEFLMVEQGFKSSDARYAMAQLSESMTRICRLIASIRVHTGAWTIDQAAAFFGKEAHIPAPAARQEAERTAYDPTNGGYFLGKRAALKLRRDYEALLGARYSLREFHERVMTNGIAPWWAHRYLMLSGQVGRVVE